MTVPLRPPRIVHHSAALDGHDAPHNSLELVKASLEQGADCIELDITALLDDDYLLVHDSVLELETTGSGPVADCTMRDARELLYTIDGAATTVRVPLLSDVVTLFTQYPTATQLQLDFKNVIPFADDEPLHRLLNIIEPIGARVIITCPADWQLRRIHQLAPTLNLGFDPLAYLDWHDPTHPRHAHEYPQRVGAYGYLDDHPIASHRIWSAADYLADRCAMLIGLVPSVSTIYVRHQLLVQSLDDGFSWANALHDAGILCAAWTLDVGDPIAVSNLTRLLDAGIDQFTTNTPLALAMLLNRAG